MPVVPVEKEVRTPRTRRQVEIDAARQRREEMEDEPVAETSAPEETAGPSMTELSMASLFKELQKMMQANQEAMQANQEAIIGKLDTGLQVIQQKMEKVETDLKQVSCKTDELEERVDAHDDRLMKITSKLNKLEGCVTTPMVSAPAKFDVPHFDGTSSSAAFKYQFETLAKGNGWSDEQAFTALTLALRGDALLILENLPHEERSLATLMDVLETRYGEKHLEHVFRAQLRERTQKASESLQQWATEIERIVRRAYSSSPATIEVTLLQAFVDGIRDAEVRAAVRLGHHQTIKGALAHALEVEAVRQDSRVHKLREIAVAKSGRTRFSPTCYVCGEKGHISLDCTKRKRRRVTNTETQVEEDLPLN